MRRITNGMNFAKECSTFPQKCWSLRSSSLSLSFINPLLPRTRAARRRILYRSSRSTRTFLRLYSAHTEFGYSVKGKKPTVGIHKISFYILLYHMYGFLRYPLRWVCQDSAEAFRGNHSSLTRISLKDIVFSTDITYDTVPDYLDAYNNIIYKAKWRFDRKKNYVKKNLDTSKGLVVCSIHKRNFDRTGNGK